MAVMRARRNVLLSAAGRRVALLRNFGDAIAALGLDAEVVAADAQPASAAFQLADRSVVVPRCDDPAFAGEMVALCDRFGIALVVPTIDTELAAWASLREPLAAAGTVVAVSAPEAVAVAADKVATNELLRRHGLPATEQVTPAAARAAGGSVFPLVAKDRRGSCSLGLRRLRHPDELSLVGPDDVLERVAPGVEYTVDVFVGADGRAVCAVPRRRMEVRGGEVSKGVVELHPELIDLAGAVCEALPGAFGVLNVQIMWDRAIGVLTVIEINARFGGGFPLTHAAGGDFPRLLLEDVFGLPSSAGDVKLRDGLAMLRYDDAVFVDRSTAGW